MKTVIQQLINSFEIDRMQSTYTKEQIIELLNFKLQDENKQILDAWKEGYDLAINGERLPKL